MRLNSISRQANRKHKAKRLGRGYGSGKGGHTVGLGTKGQKARGRRNVALGFEGGQVPLYKKMPKRSSFRTGKKADVMAISLKKLNAIKEGSKVTPSFLLKEGLISRIPRDGIKLLANGTLEKKLELAGFMLSAGAKLSIEKSGSKIIES